MHIKPLWNCDHIKNPFWRGAVEVWTHGVWALPLAFAFGVFLKWMGEG